jgi:SulP family sulfate permease
MAQLQQFKTVIGGHEVWLSGSPLYIMAGLVALTIGIVILLPRITKAVPPSLVAIIVVFIIVSRFRDPYQNGTGYCGGKRRLSAIPYPIGTL